MRGTLVVAASIAAAAASLPACGKLECGTGTIEKDNECIASTDPGINCAPGTTYSSVTGRCENDLFNGGGLCGDNTTQVINDAGVRVCQGTGGGSGDCNTPLPCPATTVPNAVSLCGRIYDIEDNKPLDDGKADNGEPYLTLEIKVLNPFEFIGNPNAPALAKATPDSCGRFAFRDVPRPGAGAVAVVTDDVLNEQGTPRFGDNVVLTGIAALVDVGAVLTPMRAWTMRRTTDMAWSTSAGLPSGQTFGTIGVYVPIFLAPGTPVAPFTMSPTPGVKVALVDTSGTRTVSAEKDFYFGDTAKDSRKVVDSAKDSTGANGTGLYIMNPGLGTFSGLGASPSGTCWEKSQAAAPTGGVFVQERTADAQSCP